MKLRKTRIKKETLANGRAVYTAQYKWWFWWYDFGDFYADRDMNLLWQEWEHMNRNKSFGVDGKDKAKHQIDFYVRRLKHKQACEIGNTVVKSEYEKYP